jgi:hypothetical protein
MTAPSNFSWISAAKAAEEHMNSKHHEERFRELKELQNSIKRLIKRYARCIEPRFLTSSLEATLSRNTDAYGTQTT